MGLFGDVDASDIPDDPFYVAPGTYLCVVSDAQIREKKDGSGSGLAINYEITEPESDFNGMRIQEWKNRHTGSDLDSGQRQDNARIKQRLLALGVSESLMNEDPDEWLTGLIGVEVYVTVTENYSKDGTRKYTNVQNTRLVDA